MPERPDYVASFIKPPKTEIKKIGANNWYLYEVSYTYDSTIKRTRKISGRCLGKITPEGLVPSKRRMVRVADKGPVLNDTIDIGAVLFYWERSADLRARLCHFFPDHWKFIYCIALLRLFKDVRFKRLQTHFEHSLLGYLFPNLRFTQGGVSAFLRDFGKYRDRIAAFMRQDLNSREAFILFDGHRLLTSSLTMELDELGYDSKMRYKPQTNLLYIFSLTEEAGLPAYYKQYLGSTPDVTAFRDILAECRLSGAQYTVVGDKGFGSEEGFKQIEESGLNHIIPLRRGSRFVTPPDSPTKYAGMFTYHNRAIYYKSFVHEGFTVWLYYDARLYADESADECDRLKARNEARKKQREHLEKRGDLPEKLPDDLKDETFEDMVAGRPEMGTFAVRTNRQELSGEDVYRIYKRRQAIEQFFKTYGATMDFEASYMRGRTTQETWLFLNHLSAQLGMASLETIDSLGEKKNISLNDLHQDLDKITASKILGKWHIAPIKKAIQRVLDRLEVEITEETLEATIKEASELP